jgi:hypothetical protein
MSNDRHNPDRDDRALNPNNRMSDDPGDGSRKSDTLGRDGPATAAETKPKGDRRDESTIEAFGEEGAGIAPKE